MGRHTIGDSSRAPGKDWVLRATQSPKLERIEAFFYGHGYEMHRHDTYAIGRTLSGVQSFNYGKELQHSLPGRTMVLHPDEPHDGHAGTEDGFHYRMFYVEPAHLQQVLGGKPLPFIKGGISGNPGLFAATQVLLQNMECAIDPLEMDDALFDLATALQAASGVRTARQTLDYPAAQKAREFLLASWQRTGNPPISKTHQKWRSGHQGRHAVTDDPLGVPDPGDLRTLHLDGPAQLAGDALTRYGERSALTPVSLGFQGSFL
jgi:hypothetical protein